LLFWQKLGSQNVCFGLIFDLPIDHNRECAWLSPKVPNTQNYSEFCGADNHIRKLLGAYFQILRNFFLNLGQLEKSFGFKDSKQFLLCLKEKYQVIVQLQALQNSDLP